MIIQKEMKKSVIILSILTLSMCLGCIEYEYSPIPSNYYEQMCTLESNESLVDDYLTNRMWHIENQYEEDKFDCSQMTSCLEYILENCGHDAKICVGNNHSFLLIYLEKGTVVEDNYYPWQWTIPKSGYYPYESTEWYFPEDTEEYICERQYEDIFEIWDYYKDYSNGLEEFNREWNWGWYGENESQI